MINLQVIKTNDMRLLFTALACFLFMSCDKGEETFVGTWKYIGSYNSSGEPDTSVIDTCCYGSQIDVLNCHDVTVKIVNSIEEDCDTIESLPGSGEVSVINENYLLIYWSQWCNTPSPLSNHREFDNIRTWYYA